MNTINLTTLASRINATKGYTATMSANRRSLSIAFRTGPNRHAIVRLSRQGHMRFPKPGIDGAEIIRLGQLLKSAVLGSA